MRAAFGLYTRLLGKAKKWFAGGRIMDLSLTHDSALAIFRRRMAPT